jgi:hypothetical protein
MVEQNNSGVLLLKGTLEASDPKIAEDTNKEFPHPHIPESWFDSKVPLD